MTDDTRAEGGEHDVPPADVPEVDVAGAALGALSAADDAAVRTAVAADEQAAAELATLDATVAELAWLIPQRQMNRGRSAGIRSRLVSRAAASREEMPAPRGETAAGRAAQRPRRPVTPPSQTAGVPIIGISPSPARPTPPVHRRSFNWLALAAGIALILTIGALVRVVRDQQHLRDVVAAQQASMSRQVAEWQSARATKDSLIASLTGPQTKVVDLMTDRSQDPVARMYWDQKTQEWTMYAYHMRQPEPGKTFQVWLITRDSDKPISAGTFMPDAHGSAVMHAKYPMEKGMLQKVAISEEPMGGMPSPTGPIITAGRGR